MARAAQADRDRAPRTPRGSEAKRQPTAPQHQLASLPEHILFLQSAAGNAAVSSLLSAQRQAAPAVPRTKTTGSHPLVKLGSKGPVVEELQTKLNLVPSA